MKGRLLLGLLVACHHGGSARSRSSKAASCAEVAAHVQQLVDGKQPTSDRGTHVRDIFAGHCTQDKWPEGALGCMADTASLHDGHHCKDQLTVDQRRMLDADLDAFDRDAGSRLPPACAHYKKVIEQLAKCDKLPVQARDMMKQAYDGVIGSIAAGKTTANVEQQCKLGAEAVEQATLAICGMP